MSNPLKFLCAGAQDVHRKSPHHHVQRLLCRRRASSVEDGENTTLSKPKSFQLLSRVLHSYPVHQKRKNDLCCGCFSSVTGCGYLVDLWTFLARQSSYGGKRFVDETDAPRTWEMTSWALKITARWRRNSLNLFKRRDLIGLDAL